LAEGRPAGDDNRDDKLTPLFSDQDAQDLRSRWGSIQTGFVDEPRQTVAQADELVADVMRRDGGKLLERESPIGKPVG
jgi:hypothetical protein